MSADKTTTATALTAAAKRVQTVYYVVVNGEQVDQASRPQVAKDKFAKIAAEDTTSHIVLRTGAGKVINERPAAEVAEEATEPQPEQAAEVEVAVEAQTTISIPGLGDLTGDDLQTLANAGAELKAAREKLAEDTTTAVTDVADGLLATLADALGTEAPAATEEAATEVAPAQPEAVTEAPAVVLDETTAGELKEQAAKPAPTTEAKPQAPAKTAPTAKAEAPDTSYNRMIGVFAEAVAKKQMGAGSLAGYKAGVRAVLRVLETGMDTDLTKVDIEMALAVFEAKTPTLIDQTRKTYAADFKRAVTLYRLYLADPKGFQFPAKNVRATRLVAAPAQAETAK